MKDYIVDTQRLEREERHKLITTTSLYIASFYGRVPMPGYSSSLHEFVSKLVVGVSKRATYRGADWKGREKHRSVQLLGR